MTTTIDYDVIVIGAGIAGVAAAYEIAKLGLHALVLEKCNEPAMAASGNDLAIIYPRIEASINKNTVFYSKALDHFLNLIDELGSAVLYNKCGMIKFIQHPDRSKLDKIVALSHHESYTTIKNTMHKTAHDGLFMSACGYISPKQLCKAMLNRNIDIICDFEVEHIAMRNSLYSVRGKCGTSYIARFVVIANSYLASFLSEHISSLLGGKLLAAAGQVDSITATQKTSMIKNIWCGSGYITPSLNGVHHIGSTYKYLDTIPQDSDFKPTESDYHKNMSNVNSMLDVEDCQLISSRVGIRCVTKDRMPIIGQLIQLRDKLGDGLYFSIAHGSRGLLSAPYAALTIAHHIQKYILSI